MSEPQDGKVSPALFGALVKIPHAGAPATNGGLIKRGVGSKIEDLESEFSMILEMHDRNANENEELRTALEEIAEERDIEAKNNDLLISLILRLRQPPTPRYEDDYYVFRLQNLNESITSWITAAFKAKEFEQPMSATEEEQLTHLLRKNLPEHIVWLEAIRQRSAITYSALHSKPHSRIALARHLVALSIWRNIFHPLCFGLSGDLKHGMKTVMNSVYTEEEELSTMTIVKQAIGRGLLRHLEPSHESLKRAMVQSLDQILTLLLPTPYKLLPRIEKTINMAVELKNEMVCEQGLFEWRMIRSEEPFSPQIMEFSPEEQSGAVFVCTFPGLFKTDYDADGRVVDLILTKANVELESLFLEFHRSYY